MPTRTVRDSFQLVNLDLQGEVILQQGEPGSHFCLTNREGFVHGKKVLEHFESVGTDRI